ncbi:hypothetical protein O7627_06415 [Solwaraspora sp. WMMD1047]|uniref:hypothetical protein n=1 Tax=Solwaraspora sp. WMMD1047 TaxID=3016102 RepID=UPI002416377D|nr:hypothetical protein [Solwaraspora sp. WMMD1047]MDG4828940.1 hypothetical protein [Solwaraspora sp. WMMD1047]
MTEANIPADRRLPAIGQPPTDPDPDGDPDFANEHEETAVSSDVITGDEENEPESPRGWAGLERDRGPLL